MIKNSIQQMFNNIAQSYDKLNAVISFGLHLKIKRKAIKNVPLKLDFKILDACTGTGDIAIYLAKNVAQNGTVIGVDFSEQMLKIAEKKAKKIDNISFINADVLNLPFEDAQFDACFISFGLRNLADLEKGLSELKRVTKKGGLVVNLDTGKPKGFFGFLYKIYFFKIVPILGQLFHGDASPYKYLPASTKNFPDGDKLVKIFQSLGFKNVKKFDFLFGTMSQQIGEV